MPEKSIFHTNNEVIYTPGDNLVSSTVAEARADLKQIVQDGATLVVVDLQHVTIVDSSGIGCLVATHNSLSKQGGSLTVINISAEIYELFHLMRLDRHFSISKIEERGA